MADRETDRGVHDRNRLSPNAVGIGANVMSFYHWKVRFTQRGIEPPRPFGKTSWVVCAASRYEARNMVPASMYCPVTASKTTDPVTQLTGYRCHCVAPEEPAP